jgi:signal transduction histidine kinase/ActR/RegA family two-component response regulator
MTRPNRYSFAVQTIVSFVLLTLIALGGFAFVDRVTSNQHDRVLEKRSGEVAILLTSALGEVRSALGLLAALNEPDDAAAFDKAAASLLTGAVRVVGRAERENAGNFVITAATGDLAAGQPVSSDRTDLFRRALAVDEVVSAVVISETGTRLVFALSDPGRSQVVFRETAVTPTEVATTVRGQPFADLQATVYAGSEPAPDAVVLSTARVPLETGVQTTLTIGADSWLLVTAPRGHLDGSLSSMSKWIVLLFGMTVAVAVAMLVETLARRRRFALQLVDMRTADLELALEERSRMEEGQREARESAESANHAKSDFLSRMSHELRTPLNGVLGFAQLLEMEPLTDAQQDSVRQISKGGWHLLGLINEVLDITRIETGAISLSPEPVSAAEVLLESLDLVGPLALQRGVHLMSSSTPGCDAFVYADRQRVKQILLNLMSNAVKYNRTGGSVAVSCVRTTDTLQISVTDTGPGIAAEHLGLLFVPFERLGAEHSDVEGTGIGLALSRRLAESMAGTLDVETAVGKGSTFHLELPLVERFVRLGPAVDHRAPGPQAPRTKVLYIEDNLANLRLVERLLEHRPDVDVVAAMQGRLGLELARQHAPAAVLLDLHLPDIDGADVLRQLREDPITAAIPVIIVSADATPGQVGRLLAAGAYAYLTKPLDVREFLQVLDQLLAPTEVLPSTRQAQPSVGASQS